MPIVFSSNDKRTLQEKFPGQWLLVTEEFRNRMNDLIFNNECVLSSGTKCKIVSDAPRKAAQLNMLNNALRSLFPFTDLWKSDENLKDLKNTTPTHIDVAVALLKNTLEYDKKKNQFTIFEKKIDDADTNKKLIDFFKNPNQDTDSLILFVLALMFGKNQNEIKDLGSTFIDIGKLSAEGLKNVQKTVGNKNVFDFSNGNLRYSKAALENIKVAINQKKNSETTTFSFEKLQLNTEAAKLWVQGTASSLGTMAGNNISWLKGKWSGDDRYSKRIAEQKKLRDTKIKLIDEMKKDVKTKSTDAVALNKNLLAANAMHINVVSGLPRGCYSKLHFAIALSDLNLSDNNKIDDKIYACANIVEAQNRECLNNVQDRIFTVTNAYRRYFDAIQNNMINVIGGALSFSAYAIGDESEEYKVLKKQKLVNTNKTQSNFAKEMTDNTIVDLSVAAKFIFRDVVASFCPSNGVTSIDSCDLVSTINVDPNQARIYRYYVNGDNKADREDVTKAFTMYNFPKLPRRHREKFYKIVNIMQRKYNEVKKTSESIAGTSLMHSRTLVYINEFGKFFLDTSSVQIFLQYHHNNQKIPISSLEMISFEKALFVTNNSFVKLLTNWKNGKKTSVLNLLCQNPQATSLGFMRDPYTQQSAKITLQLDLRKSFKTRKLRDDTLRTLPPYIYVGSHVDTEKDSSVALLQDYNSYYYQKNTADQLKKMKPLLCNLAHSITSVETKQDEIPKAGVMEDFLTIYFTSTMTPLEFDEKMQILYRKYMLTRSDNGKYYTNDDRAQVQDHYNCYLKLKTLCGGPAVFRPMPFELLIDYRDALASRDAPEACNQVMEDRLQPTTQRDEQGVYRDFTRRASAQTNIIVNESGKLESKNDIPIRRARDKAIEDAMQLLNFLESTDCQSKYGRAKVLCALNKLQSSLS